MFLKMKKNIINIGKLLGKWATIWIWFFLTVITLVYAANKITSLNDNIESWDKIWTWWFQSVSNKLNKLNNNITISWWNIDMNNNSIRNVSHWKIDLGMAENKNIWWSWTDVVNWTFNAPKNALAFVILTTWFWSNTWSGCEWVQARLKVNWNIVAKSVNNCMSNWDSAYSEIDIFTVPQSWENNYTIQWKDTYDITTNEFYMWSLVFLW